MWGGQLSDQPRPHPAPIRLLVTSCHTGDREHRHYLETETLISGSAESRGVYIYFLGSDSHLSAASISGLVTILSQWRESHPF